MKQKYKKEAFLAMLLGTIATSLLVNMLTGKGVIRAGEGTARVGYGSKKSSIKKKLQILKYKCIIKMNLDLMGFIPEIIYR